MLRRKKLAEIKRKRKILEQENSKKSKNFIQEVLHKSRLKTKNIKLPSWQEAYAAGLKTDKIGVAPTSTSIQGACIKKEIINPNIIKNLEHENEELARREAIAQEEAKIKSKRIGIIYNKGGYVYLGSGVDIKDMGKKTSQI